MLEANGEAVGITVGTTMTTRVPPTGTTTTTILGGNTGKRFVEPAEFDPPPEPDEFPVPSVEAMVKVIRAVPSWVLVRLGAGNPVTLYTLWVASSPATTRLAIGEPRPVTRL